MVAVSSGVVESTSGSVEVDESDGVVDDEATVVVVVVVVEVVDSSPPDVDVAVGSSPGSELAVISARAVPPPRSTASATPTVATGRTSRCVPALVVRWSRISTSPSRRSLAIDLDRS